VNHLLREQLDEATAANQQLVAELTAVKQDYEQKQLEWSKEEQVYWFHCLMTVGDFNISN